MNTLEIIQTRLPQRHPDPSMDVPQWALRRLEGQHAFNLYHALMGMRGYVKDGDPRVPFNPEEVMSYADLDWDELDAAVEALESAGLLRLYPRFVPRDWDFQDYSRISPVQTEEHPLRMVPVAILAQSPAEADG